MRASLPTVILMLTTGLGWLGWPATPAEAAAPGVAQATDSPAAANGEIVAPGQVVNQGQLQAQGPFLGQGAWCDEGQCEGAMAGCGAACCAPCGRCSPRWSFTAEAIALERTTTRSVPLFTANTVAATDLLDANNINFPVGYGPKVSAIRHGVCGFDVEASYFQIQGITASGFVPGTSQMTDGFGSTLLVTGGTANYTSTLYNGELNLRRQVTQRLTLLGGFRMVELDEHYLGSGADPFAPGSVFNVSTSTYNHLFGGQIGADFQMINRGGPLQINVVCKAGVLGNSADQNYRLDASGTPLQLISAPSSCETSFLGDTAVVATYAVTKHLALRASIDAIWLTGVGLAPEQLSSVNLRNQSDFVNTSGGVFYYGGSLGMECRF